MVRITHPTNVLVDASLCSSHSITPVHKDQNTLLSMATASTARSYQGLNNTINIWIPRLEGEPRKSRDDVTLFSTACKPCDSHGDHFMATVSGSEQHCITAQRCAPAGRLRHSAGTTPPARAVMWQRSSVLSQPRAVGGL